jgi:hypothetical protein
VCVCVCVLFYGSSCVCICSMLVCVPAVCSKVDFVVPFLCYLELSHVFSYAFIC